MLAKEASHRGHFDRGGAAGIVATGVGGDVSLPKLNELAPPPAEDFLIAWAGDIGMGMLSNPNESPRSLMLFIKSTLELVGCSTIGAVDVLLLLLLL